MESRWLRAGLRVWVALVLAFLFIPIVLIVLYAFNSSNIESWPIPGFSLHWFSVAWHDAQVRSAFLLSVRVGLIATALAVLLGSAVAYALHTFAFFGREAISFLLVLPLALPGIITGVALNSFFSFTGIELGTATIVIGHTTFCIVVVYNNLIARLRRTPGSLAEASQDLVARGWQTLRYVTLPLTATALISGALLAFALSFDEVIVTVFTAGAQNTLPLWIFGAIRLGQQLPEVNAVVSVVILLTLIPVILAARVAGAGAISRSARDAEVAEVAEPGLLGWVFGAFPGAAPGAFADVTAGPELARGQGDLEHEAGLHVQPQEPPLGLGERPEVLIGPFVRGDSQDFRDIGVHVRVAVGALAVDLRRAELGVGPGDVRAAEQPEVLLGDGEPPGVTNHVEQRAGAGHLVAPADVYVHALPPAEPVERLGVGQVATDHHRVGDHHGVVAARRYRLDQGRVLATGLGGRPGVGIDHRFRPGRRAGQPDHHAAGLGQAGFVAGVSVEIPDVGGGPDRNGAHGQTVAPASDNPPRWPWLPREPGGAR
jgi:putative spermidine/putrescine transport system permease protein